MFTLRSGKINETEYISIKTHSASLKEIMIGVLYVFVCFCFDFGDKLCLLQALKMNYCSQMNYCSHIPLFTSEKRN